MGEGVMDEGEGVCCGEGIMSEGDGRGSVPSPVQ